jgi:serine protease DegQ
MRGRSSGHLALVGLVAFLCGLGGVVAGRLLPSGGASLEPMQATQPHVAGAQASLSPLVKRAAPAVVNIAVLQPSPASQNPLLQDPFFRQYLGIPDAALEPTIAAGSGVIVDPAHGLVVTNFHVVENASAIRVGLRDDRTFTAKLLSANPTADLAVLQIRGKDLPALPRGDCTARSVGDYVVAIGNPFGLGQTVTAGIVSATDRALGGGAARFIQTDAPINPGNSGGPLIDMHGRVIGINSALFSPNEGNVGIGFAIPVSSVREVLKQAAARTS